MGAKQNKIKQNKAKNKKQKTKNKKQKKILLEIKLTTTTTCTGNRLNIYEEEEFCWIQQFFHNRKLKKRN